MERRVFPVQARARLLSDYRGPTDPARASPSDLQEEEVRRRLAQLKGLDANKVPMMAAVEPFSRVALPNEVCSLDLALGKNGKRRSSHVF